MMESLMASACPETETQCLGDCTKYRLLCLALLEPILCYSSFFALAFTGHAILPQSSPPCCSLSGTLIGAHAD